MGLRGRAAALAVISAALAGCGGGSGHQAQTTTSAAPPEQAAPAFAYDAAAPLRFVDRGRVNDKYPIAVHDVSYRSGTDNVAAYLAYPPGQKHLPAVIYLHGSGEDRERFLIPAVWTAGRRAVGMTISLPSTAAGPDPAGMTPEESLARSKRVFVDDVTAVRRGIDLLRTLPQVDPSRIAVVGWSLGARVAAVTAGVDRRPKAFVLMSGGASPVSVYAGQAPAALREKVRATLTSIDPLRLLKHATAPILFEDGTKDTVVPHAALVAMWKAAPRKRATLIWYPTDHDLTAQAYHDQYTFLTKQLPISGPAVPKAKTGP